MLLRHHKRRPAAHRPERQANHPALPDLRAAERDLREDRLDDAWVDLENASLTLNCDPAPRPLVEKAKAALDRARDKLARAEVAGAAAAVAAAAALLGAL